MIRRRRGRRVASRLTPRRWLPFVALVGVAAGAVVVEGQVDDPVAQPRRVTSPALAMPTAAEPRSLSAAWYCSGGTAEGDDGRAELSVVIANAAGEGATAHVTVIGSNGERRRVDVDVPAYARKRVIASDHLRSAWAGMVVEVIGGRANVERGVSGPDGYELSPCSSAGRPLWYVPSGTTVRGANEYLAILNPFPESASVDIAFATDQGAREPRDLRGLSVPARSLRVVNVGQAVRRHEEIAATVTTRTGRVVVDRTQVFDGSGDPVTGDGDGATTTDPPRGVAATSAIPATAPRWIFPDGTRTAGGRTLVAVHNPSRREARVDMFLTHERPERYPEVEPVQLTLQPESQQVVDLTDMAALNEGVGFTIDVRSIDDVPVVAEQLSLSPAQVTPEPEPAEEAPEEEEGEEEEEAPDEEVSAPEPAVGFTVTAGSPVAAESWLLGSSQSDRSATQVVVANPGHRAVTVEVDQLVDGQRTTLDDATVEIPPGDRRTLVLADVDRAAALDVRADGPVVVSRLLLHPGDRGVSLALATPYPDAVRALPAPN